MKKILVTFIAFILLGNSFTLTTVFAESAETLITNGSFAEGVDGWLGVNGAEISYNSDEASDCIGGSMVVNSLSDDGGAAVDVKLRKYKWYHLTAKVKLTDGEEASYLFSPIFRYSDGSDTKTAELFDSVSLKKGEWTKLDGWFQTPILDEIPAQSDSESVYIAGNIILKSDKISKYLIDDVNITGSDCTMDPYLEKGTEFWSYKGNIETVKIDAEIENLSELMETDDFPAVSSVSRFIPSNDYCDGPRQLFAMESGENYEFTAWFKGENVQANDYVQLILDRAGNGMGNFGSNTTVIGHVDVSDGKWHRLKAVINFPVGSTRYSGDAEIKLRLANRIWSGTAQGRKLVIAQCEIKKQENLIQNPYFVTAGASTYASDYTGKTVDVSGWMCDGTLTSVYDTARTHDGSKLYGKLIYDGSSEMQSVYQTVHFKDGDYKMSVWAKLGDDYPFESALGKIYADDYQSLSGDFDLYKDKWTKITLENYEAYIGEKRIGLIVGNYGEDDIFETPASGSICFADFTVCENTADVVNVKLISTDGEFYPDKYSPDIYVYTDSKKMNMVEYEYYVCEASEYSAVYSDEIFIKSGDKIPSIYIDPAWSGMKMKVRAVVRNSKGVYGDEYITEPFLVKSDGGDETGVIPFNEIFDNEISNGTFEQGTEGWSTVGGGELLWERKITDSDSVGSAFVRQKTNTEDGAECDFRVRRGRKYKFSAKVKLKDAYSDSTKIRVFLKFDNNGTEVVSNIASITVKNNSSWQTLESEYRLSAALDSLENATAAENIYRNAKLVFKAERGKDSSAAENLSEFYIDNVFITEVQEIDNIHFTEGYGNWSVRGESNNTVSFDRKADGVEELAEIGEFPDVDKCLEITNTNSFIDSPQKTFEMDANVTYELSAWVKVKDAKAGDYMNVILIRQDSDLTGSGYTYATFGRTDMSDGKWHHIKGTICFPSGLTRTAGDAIFFLRMSEDDKGAFVASTENTRTFYLAEFDLKKQENLITNPYFVQSTQSQEASDVSKTPNISGWNFEGNGTSEYNAEKSFDGAAVYGKMTVTGSMLQSVYQTVQLENKARYRLSLWARAENVPEGDLKLVAYEGEKSNVIGETQITDEEWIKTENFEFTHSGETGDTRIGFYLASGSGTEPVSGGNLYFENVVLEEVKDIVPKISAEIKSCMSGNADSFITVTNEEDVLTGCRYSYYLSENGTDDTQIFVAQTDIGESPGEIYCNLGWEGKKIRAEITPVSRYGVYGETVYTDWITVKSGIEVTGRAEASPDSEGMITAEADIKNNFGKDIYSSVIFVYTDNNGEIKDIGVKNIVLSANSLKNVNCKLKTDSEYQRGNVSVYVWNSSKGGIITPSPLAHYSILR